MIEQGLFKRHFVGRDGFHWWIGQIVKTEPWTLNMGGSTAKEPDIGGFSYRYQVRIMGYHTDDPQVLKDEELPWASVMYPVTAGAGGGVDAQTPSLKKGNFVYGFFIDGEDAQQPVIMGIIAYNDKTKLEIDGPPFTPLLAYDRKASTGAIRGDVIPHSGVSATSRDSVVEHKNNNDDPGEGTEVPPSSTDDTTTTNTQTDTTATPSQSKTPEDIFGLINNGSSQQFVSSILSGEIYGDSNSWRPGDKDTTGNLFYTQGDTGVWDFNTKDLLEFNFLTEGVSIGSPKNCEKTKNVGKVQKDLQKALQDIENAKAGLSDVKKAIMYPINFEGKQVSIQQYINIILDRATGEVTGFISEQIQWLMEWIERKISNGMKDLYFILNPAELQSSKEIVETAMDLLVCHFKKILKNLFNMVRKALLSIVDKYINVPLCAAENIIAAIIGKLTGLINSIVSAVMGPVTAALGAVDIVGDIMGYIQAIISFLQCENPPECSEVDFWSVGQGGKSLESLDPSSLIEKIKKFASGVSDSVDPDNFDFDLDFSDIMDDSCNVEALLCGPPKAVFWGADGSGTTGNVIVSAVGDILGVDITNAGSGYTKKPFLSLEDDCGKGVGASAVAVLGPVSPSGGGGTIYVPDIAGDHIGVVGVVITDPGFDYIAVADGDMGGDGRVWSTSDQTTVKHPDDSWDPPYNPNDLITVGDGDIINTPVGSITQIICNGGAVTTLYGGIPHISSCNGVMTAPTTDKNSINPGKYPLNNNQYPVILYICGVYIANGGIGYEKGDEIVIEPDLGAKMEPIFTPTGALESVKIISGGEGFKDQPDIYIKSKTGFNAKIVPRFCIDRIGDDEMKKPGIQDKLVSVIDCVGTAPPLRECTTCN